MNKPYILYSISKSRTTQKFKSNKIKDIIKDIDMFLQTCTNTFYLVPDKIELTAFTAFDSSDPEEILIQIIKKTTERFGIGSITPIAFHYPSGKPHSTKKYNWQFSKDNFEEVLAYFLENIPMPKSNFGPLEVFISYNFKLVNLKDKKELPNQVISSSFLVWLSRSKKCSPTFFFPFEQADMIFWDYIDSIAPYLPFKLEEKFLQIAHLNKKGEINSFKKITRII